ncbi:FAD-binding protein [Actinokineospora spheciospongiae]|uniref:FAD-binding protein n=1 Tax=Actinokineospora spheciospongiae TaxID=909613 RepID=UPI000D7092F2|nr:FAD-binding protein [Actinokineospora spheciospongiae]PWW60371.1 choline dehydrogenase-like flavoprotein [Actinokineospora spheciospongiae]
MNVVGTEHTGRGPSVERVGIVVVGAGLAGLELARRLAEHGAGDVLVLEAGPVSDPTHIHTGRTRDAATELVFAPDTDPHFHRSWTSDSAHYTGVSGLRRRFGGRALYWHGVSLPLEPWALADWPAEVAADLTGGWRGGPPLYDRVTADLEAWAGRPLGGGAITGPVGGHRFRTLPTACRDTGDGMWAAYAPVDGWHADGDGLRAPWSGVRARCGVEVLRVDVRGGSAHGVVARDARGVFTVEAGAVVLCAGTVESTRLALQALHEAGVLPTPRLGGLADHIVQGFTLRLVGADGFFAERGMAPGSYHLPADPAIRSYLRVDLHRTGPGELLVDVRATGEQSPDRNSAVECDPTAELPWRAHVRTALAARDEVVVHGQRALLDAFWRTLAEELGRTPAPLGFVDFGSARRTNTQVLPSLTKALPEGVPESWTSLLGTEDHEGGCLALGSVLTDGQEFAHLPGLFANGPAVFPRIGAANPSLTTLALSRRLAATLAETDLGANIRHAR